MKIFVAIVMLLVGFGAGALSENREWQARSTIQNVKFDCPKWVVARFPYTPPLTPGNLCGAIMMRPISMNSDVPVLHLERNVSVAVEK